MTGNIRNNREIARRDSRPLLEIHLHLANGNTHMLVQNDPAAVEHILDHVSLKIFEHPTFIVDCPNSVVIYQSSLLAGISLIMDPITECLTQLMAHSGANHLELQEITEEDFKTKRCQVSPVVAGRSLVMVQEVELMSSERFWLEAHVDSAASKLQERHIVATVFTMPALVSRRVHGDGITLWNRAQMASLSFWPKPDVPTCAWSAQLTGTTRQSEMDVLEAINEHLPVHTSHTSPATLFGQDAVAASSFVARSSESNGDHYYY